MASEVVVVMVPFFAQGHLNQLLHLSRLISAYNIPIHFICTVTHNRQARLRLHGWNPENHIHFHDIPDINPIQPETPISVPNTTIHFPTHLQPSFNSTLLLCSPVTDLIRSLSQTARKVAVIHDALMSYVVQDVCSIPNAATYIFRPLSIFYYFSFTCDMLPIFGPDKTRQLPAFGDTVSQEFIEFIRLQQSHETNAVGNLYDSSKIIEGEFLESLRRGDEVKGKFNFRWAIGPFNPVEIRPDSSDVDNRHACLQWLDKQPAGSVIYVSFGTTTTFTGKQISELAVGLERSEQRFLWVVREADKGGDLSCKSVDTLPEGFEERVAGRGLVVREWAPQVEILGHVSTGGFVSHCGWNSCMEAMTAGVAIATWPMHIDQPYNAFLLLNVLGVAVVMRDWTRRDELVTSLTVENVVRKLMEGEGEGADVRKRAADLGGELRRSMENREELNSFVSYISR